MFVDGPRTLTQAARTGRIRPLFSMSHPIYVCPLDETALIVGPKSLQCPKCDQRFSIEEDIAVLDVVQSQDRHAFDPTARSTGRLDAEQLAEARKKAKSFLDAAHISRLEEAVILDLGCGFGELSCGLISSDQVTTSHVYAVDHSLESMRVLSRSAAAANRNEVHLSIQDAAALCFPPASFDLVLGSALLHHILDYRSLLNKVSTILKPGGKAVFTEPFCYGYLIPIVFLKMAVEELHINAKRLSQPEFGMCGFIIQDIADRVQHEDDSEFLKRLTDKHLFREDRVAAVCYAAGFTEVTFHNYEGASFYGEWMRHFLSVYGIQHPELVAKADGYYKVFRSIVGPALPNVTSHFKYIVLTRSPSAAPVRPDA
jgi:ubiquinone/menaquinone biosynthesis C-methylase UbiE